MKVQKNTSVQLNKFNYLIVLLKNKKNTLEASRLNFTFNSNNVILVYKNTDLC